MAPTPENPPAATQPADDVAPAVPVPGDATASAETADMPATPLSPEPLSEEQAPPQNASAVRQRQARPLQALRPSR